MWERGDGDERERCERKMKKCEATKQQGPFFGVNDPQLDVTGISSGASTCPAILFQVLPASPIHLTPSVIFHCSMTPDTLAVPYPPIEV